MPSSPKPICATVVSLDSHGPDIRVLRLKPATPFSWRAGQYVLLTFEGFPARPYSIANLPGDEVMEFHIRAASPAGAAAYAAHSLSLGERVSVTGPFGKTVLKRPCKRPVILIAGGMGFAPMWALALDALTTEHPGSVTLYWGVRSAADLYARAEIEALARTDSRFRFVPVVGDDSAASVGARQGLVTEAVLADHDDLSPVRVYLAGPPAMVQAIAPALTERGAHLSRLHSDAFAVQHPAKLEVPAASRA